MKKPLYAILIAAALGLSACGTTSATTTGDSPAAQGGSDTPAASAGAYQTPADGAKGSQSNPVKIGIMGPEIQYDYLKAEAEKVGLYVEYVTFTDYVQPNPATASGELDLNQFQHILYLAGYNNESGQPLVALQSTAIYPLGLYSKQYKAVADIPQGAQIAIPNDETNQARAISVLAQNGLLKVNDGTDLLYATPLDIDESASKVKVTPVSAEQTPRSLDDPNVAGAIINNTFALDADLDPDQAIAADDPNDPGSAPFINIWAGKAEAKDDPVVQKILEIARTDEWKKDLQEQSKGSAAIVDEGYDQLQATLADVSEQLKAHSS
ncbi:MAG: methionine ABC transporter substrate-binding protein [Propionibacteriaceae bacterium]|jgi:D-methionine transport system substrate-binding protein|nr:methionine ABC transporter substrate-binding protein [Propionibacteriaceae bacterium]